MLGCHGVITNFEHYIIYIFFNSWDILNYFGYFSVWWTPCDVIKCFRQLSAIYPRIFVNCKLPNAPFTLLRFHLEPFLLAKQSYFSSPFTLLRFKIKTDILRLVFAHVLKKASDVLFLKTRPARLCVVSVLKCLRFWCSHYRFAFLFSSVFIQLRCCQHIRFAPFLGCFDMNAKPKAG